MKMLRILVAAASLLLPGAALAQQGCNGQFAAGQICGNAAASQGLPGASSIAALLDRSFGSAQGTVLNRGAGAWSATATPTFGQPGVTQGSITLAGQSSGAVTIRTQINAGTWTMQLPTGPGSSTYVLSTDGTGVTFWAPSAGGGSVTSVALVLPASVFSVTGSPVTLNGTLTGTFVTQSANMVWAGPTTGAAATPTFRSLVGADLPNPGLSSFGGIQAVNAVSHEWINSISTSGVPGLTQPGFADISGNISPSQLPVIGNNTVISNISGATTTPLANTVTSIIDSAIGSTQGNVLFRNAAAWVVLAPGTNGQFLTSGGAAANVSWTTLSASALLDTIDNTQGDILYRGASGWTFLAPGTNGFVLTTGGPAANPSWVNPSSGGTVTSVTCGTGLSGGTFTTSGTCALASIATGNVLANVSGISAAPSATTPSAVLDVIGSTEGDVLYRGASAWTALTPGTNGQFLQTKGAGATPQWTNIASNLTAGSGIAITGTTTATIAAVLTNYMGGLILSNDATTPNSVLDIAAGMAADSTNAVNITLGAFKKSTAGVWTSGTGNNGMGNGLTIAPNVWYHVCLANNGGTADIWFDTSATCTNRPAGISDTKYRRLGSFATDASSHIDTFVQDNNSFMWASPVLDVNANNPGTSAVTRTLSVPMGVRVRAYLMVTGQTTSSATVGTEAIYISDLSLPDQPASLGAAATLFYIYSSSTTVNMGTGSLVQVMTNTSSQIRSRIQLSDANTNLYITTIGWIDTSLRP